MRHRKIDDFGTLSPVSPFVTNLVEPSPPYVTGQNGDKPFRNYIKKIVSKNMEYVFTADLPAKCRKDDNDSQKYEW